MVFNRKPEPAPSADTFGRRNGADEVERTLSATQSVIGSDLSIEGQSITIRCKGSLTVHGNIGADVHSRRLEVGREATIQGTIAAETVDVHGRVHGAILGKTVNLHATAGVEGDIHSHTLSIEQGATFDGRSRRVANPADIAPQLDRSQPETPAHAAFASGSASRLHS